MIKFMLLIIGILSIGCVTSGNSYREDVYIPNCYDEDVYLDAALNIIDTYTCDEEDGNSYEYEEVREVEELHLKMRRGIYVEKDE